MSELPYGWTRCLMRDIARVVGGGTPKASDPENFTADGHPWITPADLSGYKAMYVDGGKRFLSEQGLRSSSAVMLPPGTVLFTSRAPIGYVAIAGREIATNQGFRSFICEDGILPEYVYFYLKTIKPLAEQMASGTTFLEISGTNAGLLPIVIPPVNEQRRIAKQLEVLLSRAELCRERLDTVPAILRRFRQSVLAAACSGNLTADWRAENPNEEWKNVHLKDLLREPLANGRSVVTAHSGFPVLRLTCLKNGRIDITERKIGAWTINEAKNYLVKQGDFYVSRGNGSLSLVGRGGLVDRQPDNVAYPDTLIRLRMNEHLIAPNFLRVIWDSDQIRRQVELSVRTTAGIHKINQTSLEAFTLTLPDLEEQQEIVRRVDALFKVADGIEERYNKARAHVDRLTQSILAKAFRGELVPQDPNDEPAEKLLERIRAKETQGAPKLGAARRSPRKNAPALSLDF